MNAEALPAAQLACLLYDAAEGICADIAAVITTLILVFTYVLVAYAVQSFAGFGDVALAGELDWEPGAGPVYLRRLADGQLWRADITITARPARPGEPGTH